MKNDGSYELLGLFVDIDEDNMRCKSTSCFYLQLFDV